MTREQDAVGFRYERQKVAIAVEPPRAPLFDHVDRRLFGVQTSRLRTCAAPSSKVTLTAWSLNIPLDDLREFGADPRMLDPAFGSSYRAMAATGCGQSRIGRGLAFAFTGSFLPCFRVTPPFRRMAALARPLRFDRLQRSLPTRSVLSLRRPSPRPAGVLSAVHPYPYFGRPERARYHKIRENMVSFAAVRGIYRCDSLVYP